MFNDFWRPSPSHLLLGDAPVGAVSSTPVDLDIALSHTSITSNIIVCGVGSAITALVCLPSTNIVDLYSCLSWWKHKGQGRLVRFVSPSGCLWIVLLRGVELPLNSRPEHNFYAKFDYMTVGCPETRDLTRTCLHIREPDPIRCGDSHARRGLFSSGLSRTAEPSLTLVLWRGQPGFMIGAQAPPVLSG